MSTWYYLSKNGVISSSSTGRSYTIEQDNYGNPRLLGDIIVGVDAPKPKIYTYLRGTSSSNRVASNITEYYDEFGQNSAQTFTYQSGASSWRRGYPLLVKCVNAISTTPEYFDIISNSQISGRLKFKGFLNIFPSYIGSFIPIKFYCKNIEYIGFCLGGDNKVDWYTVSTGQGISQTRLDLMGISSFSSSTPSHTIGMVRKEGFNNNSPIIDYITDDYENNYANEYIDFGDIPQDLPEFFATWLSLVSDVAYNNNYYIYNSVGTQVLASITDAPEALECKLTIIGNTKTLTLTGVNGIEYETEWESPSVEGKSFLGLSDKANSTRPIIKTNETTTISLKGDISLYECFGVIKPTPSTFDITLYNSIAENNRVDKTYYLIYNGKLSGALREESSLITPTILFQSNDVPTFNYVHIPIFNRYYFVTDLTSVNKNLWRMSLKCDVLMTYKTEIGRLNAVIARQENDYSPDLIDSEMFVTNEENITYIPIESDIFNTVPNTDSYNFVINVVGGTS